MEDIQEIHRHAATGEAMELRRAQLGLDRTKPGLLVADGFSGNFATAKNEDPLHFPSCCYHNLS